MPGNKYALNFTDLSEGIPTLDMPERQRKNIRRPIRQSFRTVTYDAILAHVWASPGQALNKVPWMMHSLRLVGGNITKLRMDFSGFTALEWAAKKGNIGTVEWLCTDDRTKILLNVGCPVGWHWAS